MTNLSPKIHKIIDEMQSPLREDMEKYIENGDEEEIKKIIRSSFVSRDTKPLKLWYVHFILEKYAENYPQYLAYYRRLEMLK